MDSNVEAEAQEYFFGELSFNDKNTTQSAGEFPLLDLPPELLLRVFDYLESSTVILTLSVVCRQLRSLIKDDSIWRRRIHYRWPGKRYPVIEDMNFNWKKGCMAREADYRRWKNNEVEMTETQFHFTISSVDAVHIANNLLAVGSRDQMLGIYHVDKIPMVSSLSLDELKSAEVLYKRAHKGWIWTIASHEEKLCSGGWDSRILSWDLVSGQQLSEKNCKSAVLCSAVSEHEILAGTFNKQLVQIDDRSPAQPQLTKLHKMPVLCIAADQNWIITGSEDKTICVTDRKSHNSTYYRLDAYPRSLSWQDSSLYVGLNDGSMVLYEFNKGALNLREKSPADIGHFSQVTAINHSFGSVISASADKTCKIWEPSSQPSLITELNFSSSVCDMSYRPGCLAIGLAELMVVLYRENRLYLNTD